MTEVWNVLKEQLLQLLAVAPSIIKALAVFLLGWVLARFLAKIVKRIMVLSGIDALAEKLNAIDLLNQAKIRLVPSKLVSVMLYYLVLWIFIVAAIDALGIAVITNLMTEIINYLPKLIAAFMVLIFGIVLADFLKKIVQTACESLGITSGKLIANAVFYFLFLNVVLVTLKQAELQTSFMETNLSIIISGVVVAFAVGYGLASRDLLSNLLASFYNKDRIRLGDIIVLDGVKGEVVDIDSMRLTLWTGESRVVFPLSKLAKEKYEIRHHSIDPNMGKLPYTTGGNDE